MVSIGLHKEKAVDYGISGAAKRKGGCQRESGNGCQPVGVAVAPAGSSRGGDGPIGKVVRGVQAMVSSINDSGAVRGCSMRMVPPRSESLAAVRGHEPSGYVRLLRVL